MICYALVFKKTQDGAIITGLSGEGMLSAMQMNPTVNIAETPYTFCNDTIAIQAISGAGEICFQAEEVSIR